MPLPLLLLAGGVALAVHESRRPRNVFFSFHYADIWKVKQVSNSWVTHRNERAAGFFDASLRERAKTQSESVLRQMIDEGLAGTEATAVLIGGRTHSRKWVRYEIEESALRGNRLLGISLHELRGPTGRRGSRGQNPFDNIALDEYGATLGDFVEVYDWVAEDGYTNLREWVRDAPTLAEIRRQL